MIRGICQKRSLTTSAPWPQTHGNIAQAESNHLCCISWGFDPLYGWRCFARRALEAQSYWKPESTVMPPVCLFPLQNRPTLRPAHHPCPPKYPQRVQVCSWQWLVCFLCFFRLLFLFSQGDSLRPSAHTDGGYLMGRQLFECAGLTKGFRCSNQTTTTCFW